MQRIIIICGPTASGKTRAGIELAKHIGGEIVSADSQQVWRGFDIGTAKPAPEERVAVPHHLIDVADPAEQFDAARFVELADRAIADIASRGRVPIVVGGTGMYLRMLVHGFCSAPPRDPEIRARLEAEIENGGLDRLYKQLLEVDPESAAKIKPNDTARIIRALEIHRISGVAASRLRNKHNFSERRYAAAQIGLSIERAELYRRIDVRVDRMIEAGLVDEVRRLRLQYGDGVQPFAAVGYKELAAHLRGECDFETAVSLIKRNTRRYAKRQMTWFRADSNIRWISSENDAAIAEKIAAFCGYPVLTA